MLKLVVLIALLLAPKTVLASEDETEITNLLQPAKNGVAENHQLFLSGAGQKNARLKTMQSEMLRRSEQNKLALAFGRKAVAENPDDIDARVALGETLSQIIQKGNDDPAIFNECVKTWLVVHRNLVGEDKELSFKGISLPFAQKLFKDQRHDIASSQLNQLVGRLPKPWETNQKYLSRVLKGEKEVEAKIIPRDSK